MPPVLLAGLMVMCCLCLVGCVVVMVAEELRHRRNERDVNIDALVKAFQIHEVAASARQAMADEIERLSETER